MKHDARGAEWTSGELRDPPAAASARGGAEPGGGGGVRMVMCVQVGWACSVGILPGVDTYDRYHDIDMISIQYIFSTPE